MAARHHLGERVAVLETKIPLVEQKLADAAASLEKFSTEIHKLQTQLARLSRLFPVVGWLGSAALLQLVGENVARLCVVAWKAVLAAL